MDISNNKHLRFLGTFMSSKVLRCLYLIFIALLLKGLFLLTVPAFRGGGGLRQNWIIGSLSSVPHYSNKGVRNDKFLEVPQIAWGLNNQKIAIARACLTARMMNRTLLLPSLSASLFYKETNLLKPISFDKIFNLEKFNSLCTGFVQLGRSSEVINQTNVLDLIKGSGRKWTVDRDLDQIKQFREDPLDGFEVIRIVGKNPFLWHDHWPVKDYAKVFECLVLVDEIAEEAEKVISKIREVGSKSRSRKDTLVEKDTSLDGSSSNTQPTPYVAVHMRIEIDWMIHCKKLEQRYNISEICSSKEEIMERVGKVIGRSGDPTIVYLAVADSLLEDSSILNGWKEGLLPFEKKKLGVWDIYSKYPYLIQSAIDYEVCLRADVFVGNSFSTFSSLIALERTQKLLNMGVVAGSCDRGVRWPSYAYNILGESGGAKQWMSDMSASSLQTISYGTNNISC